MADDFKTQSAASDSLNILFQLMEGRRRRMEFKHNQEASSLNDMNNAINRANNSDSLDNLVSLINAESGSYTTPSTKTFAQNLKNTARIKSDKIDYYEGMIDDMSSKYLGNDEFKGYQNLTKNDFKDWTYDSISTQLQDIRDFETMVNDEAYDINSYNPTGIKTVQLNDRIKQYKNKLLTGLEATKGDNLVTDNELIYILTGDEQGLKTARTTKLTQFNKQKGYNGKAISAIKKNIAKLREYTVKQSIQEKLQDGDFPNLYGNTIEDYGLSKMGMDELEQKYANDFYAQTNGLFEEGELEDYIIQKFNEDLMKRPDVLIVEWQNELQSYEHLNEKLNTEIKKWGGKDLSGFDAPIDMEALEENMQESVFGKTKIIIPQSPDEVPLDLVSLSGNEKVYYSQKTGKYYDKKKVNELLGF